jgi:hypothetical protein
MGLANTEFLSETTKALVQVYKSGCEGCVSYQGIWDINLCFFQHCGNIVGSFSGWPIHRLLVVKCIKLHTPVGAFRTLIMLSYYYCELHQPAISVLVDFLIKTDL